jgi:hypothetical protein
VRRDLLIVACSVSAGIHAALAPEHFHESVWAGAGFLAAAGLLGALAVALTYLPGTRSVPVAAALTLAGLIASYLVVVWRGLPVLHPETEPVDGLAVVTKAIETVGTVAAVSLAFFLRREGARA